MFSLFLRCVVVLALLHAPVLAQEGAMTRILHCRNDDAQVELYIAASIVLGTGDGRAGKGLPADGKAISGYYALDLSAVDKGKSLEPARVSSSRDRQSLIVEQHTRRLPPTTVPRKGGKVSFDRRFAADMVCAPVDVE